MNAIVRSTVAAVAAFCSHSVVTAQSGSGLEPVGPWVAEVGARASNQRDLLLLQSGSIRTNRLYSDFVLRLDFRFVEPDSEGRVLVRSWLGYGNSPSNERGYRVALTNRATGREALGRVTASEVSMREVMFGPADARPGDEWQHLEVRAERDRLAVRLNDGRVGDIRVNKSLHPDLDEAAMATARKWRFTPGKRSGQPVSVIVTMDLAFALRK